MKNNTKQITISAALSASANAIKAKALEATSELNELDLSATDNLTYYVDAIKAKYGLPTLLKAHNALAREEFLLDAIEKDCVKAYLFGQAKVVGTMNVSFSMDESGFIQSNAKIGQSNWSIHEMSQLYKALISDGKVTTEQVEQIGPELISVQTQRAIARLRSRIFANALAKTEAKVIYTSKQDVIDKSLTDSMIAEYEAYEAYMRAQVTGEKVDKRPANPFSNASIKKELDGIVKSILGDGYESKSKHIQFLKLTCVTGSKASGKMKPISSVQFEDNVKTILYCIANNIDITIKFNEKTR